MILCSDGLLQRRTASGQPLGLAGVRRAVSAATGASAAATARSLQHAALEASRLPLEDDAVVVILAAD